MTDVSPHLDKDLRTTKYVEIDIPPETLAACQETYEQRKRMGAEPDFEEFLWDTVEIEPLFTCNGRDIDLETGGLR